MVVSVQEDEVVTLSTAIPSLSYRPDGANMAATTKSILSVVLPLLCVVCFILLQQNDRSTSLTSMPVTSKIATTVNDTTALLATSSEKGNVIPRQKQKQSSTKTKNDAAKVENVEANTTKEDVILKHDDAITKTKVKVSLHDRIDFYKQQRDSAATKGLSLFQPDTRKSEVLLQQQQQLSSSTIGYPILNVGFPKMGSTTLEEFFLCRGYRTSHWYTDRYGSVGKCMRNAIASDAPPLSSCDHWQWKQFPRNKATYEKYGLTNVPDTNVEAWMEMNVDDLKSSWPSSNSCIFPQSMYLEQIHTEAPNATFILTFRDMVDWYQSILHWGDMKRHMIQCDTPGFGGGLGTQPEHFIDWFASQVERIREFVQTHPSHTLVEIDLYNDTYTSNVMNSLFPSKQQRSINVTATTNQCWGHANQNPKLLRRRRYLSLL